MKNVILFPSLVSKALSGAVEIIDWLTEKDIAVNVPEDIARLLDRKEISDEVLKKDADLVISLGGDGTFLRAARFIGSAGIPIIGINLGSLGFLTEVPKAKWESALESVIEGNYVREERMVLSCEVWRESEKEFEGWALNDVVIHRGIVTRILHLTIHIDEREVGTYASDGLIICTPTGSTAYSLSCGGPIVNPEVRCMLLTAICPHTLSARPLIITEKETVSVREPILDGISLMLDGHTYFALQKEDEVRVRKAAYGVTFLHLEGNFYGIIREKLKWISPRE